VTSYGFIPSPASNGFHLGPFFFHMYGVMYVLAVAAAIVVARHEWVRRGGLRDDVYEAAWWGFPAGLIGGRIYFLITTPSQIPPHWYGFLAIWDGGLGIWGGIAGGVAAGVWRLRRRLDWSGVREFMNSCGPCLPVAQAIGRIGNYFNQELYGGPSKLPWALKIDQPYWPSGYKVPAQFIHSAGGRTYATFQPSFLYEMIFDFGWAAFLVWLGHHRRIKAPGLFALYVAGYCAYRIFEETIRIDYSVHILGMRLNFWVATLGFLIAMTWFVRIQLRREPAAEAPAARARAGSSRSVPR
jgi:prolipoprotein diacylglyceryl transferase